MRCISKNLLQYCRYNNVRVQSQRAFRGLGAQYSRTANALDLQPPLPRSQETRTWRLTYFYTIGETKTSVIFSQFIFATGHLFENRIITTTTQQQTHKQQVFLLINSLVLVITLHKLLIYKCESKSVVIYFFNKYLRMDQLKYIFKREHAWPALL